MKKNLIITFAFFLWALFIAAQEEDFEGTRLFYRTEIYGGATIHTNGWGINLVKAKRITGFKKWLFSAEIVGMKHPKEDKRVNAYEDNTKRYVYGKLNYFTILRPAIGRQKVVYTKQTKRGVQIGYNYLLGASIGLLRPVYLEIAYPDILSKTASSTAEPYDPNLHKPNMILGRASYFRGFEQTKIYPGVHARFGLNFEYAPADNLIRSIETGIAFDGFHKKVPVMAFAPNQQFFITGYVTFQLGKKHIE